MVLKGLGALVLMALAACVLYIVVIMTDTPERQNTLESARAPQRSTLSEGDNRIAVSSLAQAAEYFDGRMLVLSDSSGYRLESIELRDWKPDGAPETVRALRLGYAGDTGALWVSSVSSAGYLASLPARGYAPVLEQGITLAGLQAVLMASPDDAPCVYAQLDGIVYEMEGTLSKEALCQLAWQAKLVGG